MHGRAEGGVAATEFLIVIFPLLFLVLGVMQLAQLFTASLMLEYAAHAAWRSAVVMLADGSRPRPDDAPPPPTAAERYDLIHRAAAYVMTGVSPALDNWVLEEAQAAVARVTGRPDTYNVAAALDGTESILDGEGPFAPFGLGVLGVRKLAYSTQATAVTLVDPEEPTRVVSAANPDGKFRLRVTYLFRCAIPLIAPLVCRSFGALAETAREDLRRNPSNLLLGDWTPGYYLALSAEADGVAQGEAREVSYEAL